MSMRKFIFAPGHSMRRGILALGMLIGANRVSSAIVDEIAVLPNIVIATNVAGADSDTTNPGRPGVGFDGTNYMVVTDSPSGLVGVILSPKGSVVQEFPIGGQVSSFPDPCMAFDGTNYLLVFNRQGQIYGLRISRLGQLLDTNDGFPISTGTPYQVTNYRPGVAFDGLNFLVVWQKYQDPDYDIYGARVTPGGQVLGEFLIFTAPLWQTYPQVAFDGANCLVVWEHEYGTWPNTDTDIYGTRVSPAGTVLDPAGIPICSATNYQGAPHLAFDGQNYLVVWVDRRNHPSDPSVSDIFATRVATNGSVLDGADSNGGIAINTLSAEYKRDPRVCYDGQDFFVAWWIGQYSSQGGSFAARVSSAGELLDSPPNGQGLRIRAPDCYACLVVHPNPVSNHRSTLVPWVNNAELGGTSKDVLANLIVTKPTITGLNLGRPSPEDAKVTFTSRLSVPYWVQSSSNLTTWQVSASPVVGTGQPLEAVWQGGAGAQHHFFRVQPDY
jgi:hypothetical protein